MTFCLIILFVNVPYDSVQWRTHTRCLQVRTYSRHNKFVAIRRALLSWECTKTVPVLIPTGGAYDASQPSSCMGRRNPIPIPLWLLDLVSAPSLLTPLPRNRPTNSWLCHFTPLSKHSGWGTPLVPCNGVPVGVCVHFMLHA